MQTTQLNAQERAADVALASLADGMYCLCHHSDSSGRTQTLRENAQLIDSLDELPVGLGALPEPPIPSDNPQTMKKIELGRRLFFEKQLSADASLSCASCHDPKKGLSDGKPKAVGFHGAALRRRTPSIWNA